METTTVFENEGDASENLFYEYEVDNAEFKASDPHIEIPIILSIVILPSVIGNALVVVISFFFRRPHSPIIIILYLAVSDLLFTLYLVFWVYDHIWGFTFGTALCKAAHFFFLTGFYSNPALLVLMSVQRYMSVVHSLLYLKKECFLSFCTMAVTISAFLALVLNIDTVPNAQYCTYINFTEGIVALYKHIIIVVWAFLIMGFCYIRILQTIFKSPTNQRHRITGLAFFLVATYFIFWAPFNIMLFLDILRYHQMISTYNMEHFSYAREICQFLAYTRCCLNPVIYGLFGIKYRKEMREIFEREVIPNSAEMGTTEHHQLRQFN